MYTFTISSGSCAVDQRSGDGRFSGWLKILVICEKNSNARFWSTRCEDGEQNHPWFSLQVKGQSGGQKAQIEDRFLRGRQIAYLIYEYFRVTGAHDSVGNSADLFTIALRNDDIQEFDSKWDGMLLSMTKISSDDISEGLYKLRIRESEKLKTVLELYDLEIHQKKAWPDYHRLKTMVKRSIEQNLRIKNFGARNGNYEDKRRWSRIKGQNSVYREFLDIVGNGQCVKGDNCSFRHDINKRAKMTQPNPSPNSFMQQDEMKASKTRSPRGRSPSGRMFSMAMQGLPQKELASTHSVKKWHPPECLFYKTKSGCRLWGKVLLCTSPGWWTAE